MLKRNWKSTVLSLPILVLAGTAFAQQPQAADPMKNLTPVTDAMLRDPPASDWLMWRRTYNGWGYSPLDQINKDNVKTLQPAWTWSMSTGSTETTPIVHDGVLYIWNYADKVQALNGATGELIWEYKRDLPAKLVAEAGNNLAKRNMAIYDDKLIIATSDAHVVALDAKSGKVVWDHQTADWSKGWRYTGGPFIINGKVIQGMTGCGNAEPGGCFITGHDIKTGNELWRVNTIAHPGDPNYDTWNGLPLESRFGASAWISGSYDPDQNLVFYGTGQPYPWIAEMRGTLPAKPGAKHNAMYSDSTLAIDPDTGKLKWYHQHLEDDTWDLDYVYERLLIDLPVNGETRKAVITTGKLGIVEALDRTNGEWLWHKETVPQNVVASIDPKTGEKTINPAAIPHIGSDHGELPGRSRRPRLAGDRLQPEDRHLVHAAQRVLLQHHADPARSRPGLYRRRPRHLRPRIGAQQRRQYRPGRRHQAVRPFDRVVVSAARPGDGRGASDRRRARIQRLVGSLVPCVRRCDGQGAVADPPQQCDKCVPDQLQHQRQAIRRHRGRQRIEPIQVARDADPRNPESGGRVGAVGVRAAELTRRWRRRYQSLAGRRQGCSATSGVPTCRQW